MSSSSASSGKQPSPDETAAKHDLDKLLQESQYAASTGAPKGFGQGLSHGVSNIVGGAVGAAGIAVLMPTMGLAVGAKQAGIVGGVVGLVGGALVGIVGGAGMLVGGAVSGASQIVRGVIAAPEAAMAPRQGKWWNQNEGRWVLTKMSDEARTLKGVPADDSDLLGEIQADLDQQASKRNVTDGVAVNETYYYDILEVSPDADEPSIRRRYYIMARQFHPDRNQSAEAADKFKQVAEAYQVLSDPALRQKYNQHGRAGLSADKTSTATDNGLVNNIDPAVLYAFLFGSDLFHDYVGRLATATSASVGDSHKVSLETARLLQKRRLIRLAQTLLDKIEAHVQHQADGKEPKEVLDEWNKEAAKLNQASYGHELLQCIGQTYHLMATMYQGSKDSGQGLPSLSAWASRQKAILDKKRSENKNAMGGVKAGVDLIKLQSDLMVKMHAAKTVDEREALKKELNDAAVSIMLRVMWTTTVVDVTSTIYEVTHMIFFDQDASKETRWQRSEAVKALGSVFMSAPAPEQKGDMDFQQMYEDAAFAAMLETVKRRDAASN